MGRPRIYTDEERKEKARLKARNKYYRKKGYAPGECPKQDKRNHPSYSMWASAKKRAKELNVPFDLILEKMRIPETCPLLGIPIQKGMGTYTDNSPTLDRIIPEKGYTMDNTWVVSMRANRIKNNATLQELESIVNGLRQKL